MPIATPTANSSGRLANSALPAAPTTAATLSQPRPSAPSRSGWPRRSSSAAAGSAAIGSIRLRPNFWIGARLNRRSLLVHGCVGSGHCFFPSVVPVFGGGVLGATCGAGSGRRGSARRRTPAAGRRPRETRRKTRSGVLSGASSRRAVAASARLAPQRLLGAVDGEPVDGAEDLVERAAEVLPVEPGQEVARVPAVLQRDRLAVGQAHPVDPPGHARRRPGRAPWRRRSAAGRPRCRGASWTG